MPQDPGMVMLKCALYLFNLIFWICGIALLVLGSVLQVRYSSYVNFMGTAFTWAPITFIIVGCSVGLLGFFGCCGTIRENYCMTMTFSMMLFAIFIVELALGISVVVLKRDFEEIIGHNARDGIRLFNISGFQGLTEAWDILQKDYQCCGVTNYTDWENTTAYQHNYDVPDSCCLQNLVATGCGFNVRSTRREAFQAEIPAFTRVFTTGCLDRLVELLNGNASIIAGVASGVGFVQLIGIWLSCCFSYSLKKRYRHMG